MNIGHWRKYAAILSQPAYYRALRNGVAAGVEHSAAIRFAKPATLIDVGANKGQFSAVVRKLFPNAAIYAFEPLARERAQLAAAMPGEKTILPYAIGEHKGKATFYVTERADSSSLFAPKAEDNAFGIKVDRAVEVDVAHIEDHVDLSALASPVLMKIDVQGAELSVLRSMGDALRRIDFVYCEISFLPIYEGQSLATEVCAYLFDHGFILRGAYNPSHHDRLGPAQSDLLFERRT